MRYAELAEREGEPLSNSREEGLDGDPRFKEPAPRGGGGRGEFGICGWL